jgi:hypothetical protein
MIVEPSEMTREPLLIAADETSATTDETSATTDATSAMTDETSVMTGETSAMADETSAMTGETSVMTDETSAMTGETSVMTGETSAKIDTSQVDIIARVEARTSEEIPAPHSWICRRPMLRLHAAHHEGNLVAFQSRWLKGEVRFLKLSYSIRIFALIFPLCYSPFL